MLKARVNGDFNFDITQEKSAVFVNGEKINWDCRKTATGAYSVLLDHKSYVVELSGNDPANKTMRFLINGREYEVALEEPLDQLLKTMGIRTNNTHQVNEIRAPMPGMILKVLVTPGQEVKKGDPVLILEAMKMENVFKAAADGVVKLVSVKERTAVEKGQTLLVLE